MFYSVQPENEREAYKKYLQLTGALSNLFSDSPVPYLYYRAAENLFCLAFNADNLSRSDVSADAKKGTTGIGLKTFIHGNGKSFQKVAEFNAISSKLAGKEADYVVEKLIESRNLRIHSTLTQFGLDKMIYHCVTRGNGVNSLFECNMDKIDLTNLNITSVNHCSIKFTDNINEYSFNKSKSTLFKRFSFDNPVENIDIDILPNPYEYLSYLLEERILPIETVSKKIVYLPLYAPSSSDMQPAEKSGLNQWNASGRTRNANEVYIPIPLWVHKKFPDFFPNSNDFIFELELPNGSRLQSKLCQQGGKGLMSNPNRDLGHWLLRDVLKLPEGTLVSRDIFNVANIDSAIVEKITDSHYKINFASVGQYESFKETFE